MNKYFDELGAKVGCKVKTTVKNCDYSFPLGSICTIVNRFRVGSKTIFSIQLESSWALYMDDGFQVFTGAQVNDVVVFTKNFGNCKIGDLGFVRYVATHCQYGDFVSIVTDEENNIHILEFYEVGIIVKMESNCFEVIGQL